MHNILLWNKNVLSLCQSFECPPKQCQAPFSWWHGSPNISLLRGYLRMTTIMDWSSIVSSPIYTPGLAPSMEAGGYLNSPQNGIIFFISAIFWVSPKTIPSPFFLVAWIPKKLPFEGIFKNDNYCCMLYASVGCRFVAYIYSRFSPLSLYILPV